MKILSIDDSATVREIIRNALDVLGFECIEAEDGEKGLEMVRQYRHSVDLILLDWNMPVMDGLAFLKAIKSDPELKTIPVTMVTSENEKEKIITAISEGAKNYIIKPFSQEEIMKKILESLGLA
jgi:two-component system chemotaxis response regulator CheY